MSHYPQRTEKDCLNCGTIVEGHYCQHCGQENIVPKESFWGLLTHFVYDITHFDGKFFSTIKLLLGKPGFLSKEYIKGRRMSYLHPIRMYVFTSAIFFVIFFTMFNAKSLMSSPKERLITQQKDVDEAIKDLEENSLNKLDSIEKKATLTALSGLKKEKIKLDAEYRNKYSDSAKEETADKIMQTVADSLKANGIDTAEETSNVTFSYKGKRYPIDGKNNEGLKEFNFSSTLAYNRVQEALPEDKKDGWMERVFMALVIKSVDDGLNRGKQEYLRTYIDVLLHSFPKMLFISLPIFALFLKLLYIRDKNLLYADHAIFAIHLYCGTFIFLLGWFMLLRLGDVTHWGIVNWLLGIAVILIYVYHYKSMRMFYGQPRGKTILKFLLLYGLSFWMMVLLLTVFAAVSAAQLPK